MTSAINNSRNTIDERYVFHATSDKFVQFRDIIPPSLVIALEAFNPVKHTSNPLQLLVFLGCTDSFRILAKVNVWIPWFSSFFCCSSSKEIIQLAEVAISSALVLFNWATGEKHMNFRCIHILCNLPDSCRLNHASSPPTASFNISSACDIRDWLWVVISPCLLPLIIFTVFGRICPWIVASIAVVPVSSEWVLSFWTTE